jgi:chromosome segregation ATPase
MIVDLLPIIVAVLGTGGLIGAIVALVKLRPESGQIVVTAAQGALIVQSGVIDSLKDQNARQQDHINTLEEENARLRTRVTNLETSVRTLREEIREIKQNGATS